MNENQNHRAGVFLCRGGPGGADRPATIAGNCARTGMNLEP